MASDMQNLRKKLVDQGFTIHRATKRSGHVRVVPPDGGPFVTMPVTPGSKGRGMLNTIAQLKRIGFDPNA